MLLEQINSPGFTESRIGRFLQDLKQKFEEPVVVDMLCYLRLYTELALRAIDDPQGPVAAIRARIIPDAVCRCITKLCLASVVIVYFYLFFCVYRMDGSNFLTNGTSASHLVCSCLLYLVYLQ